MSKPIFKDDDPVICEECRNVIMAGMRYYSYKGKVFCNEECIGAYVTCEEAIEEYLETREDKESDYKERWNDEE